MLFNQGPHLHFISQSQNSCEVFQELFSVSFKLDFPEKLCVLTPLYTCHLAICSLQVIYESAEAAQLPTLANIVFVPFLPYLFIGSLQED